MWGATVGVAGHEIGHVLISIHAPRVGSDDVSNIPYEREWQFQSTLPVWGATALRSWREDVHSDFNPRSPCGERPHSGGAQGQGGLISIHAPRVGSDRPHCA